MKRIALVLLAVSVLALAGCGDSTGPGEIGPPYPDIDGLVVFYNFEGDYQNEVSDAHHGTASRAVTFVPGRPLGAGFAAGQAIHVERLDHVSVPDDPALDIADAITVAAWVNPEASDQASAAIVDKDHEEAYSLAMWGGIADPETTDIRAFINDSARITDRMVPMGMDVWSHIAFTFRTDTGRTRLYFNGVKVDSGLLAGPIGNSPQDLKIGYGPGSGGYKGAIDEVAIFSRALTQDEVAELYDYD
jgi:hypothetical protein